VLLLPCTSSTLIADRPRLGSDTFTPTGVLRPMTLAAGSMTMSGAGPTRSVAKAATPAITTRNSSRTSLRINLDEVWLRGLALYQTTGVLKNQCARARRLA
jgi:hypothetical protein